jgi:hypothetical protein
MKISITETGVTLDFEATTNRRCGNCTLCCKLLPTRWKKANTRCEHQRHTGCAIYAQRPVECQLFSCRWLSAPDEMAGMRRPDRSHYVIDPMFDEVRLVPNDGGEPTILEVLQIWMDPAHPEAERDPALRAYMLRMAEKYGVASLLRWASDDATAVFPPPLSTDGEWHERRSRATARDIGLWSQLAPENRPPE